MSLALATSVLCTAAAQAADPPPQRAQAQHRYDIAAGNLDGALKAFARQSDIALTADASLTHGKSSAGLHGNYTVPEGLAELLTSAGLQAVEESIGSYTIKAGPAPPSTTGGAVTLPSVKVKGAEVEDTIPPPYAGGQVARGGQVGVLGNRDIMDTPFSQMNYTSKLIQDQQATTLGEVLTNDPSVGIEDNVSASGVEIFSIRGFVVNNADFAFNGLMGVAPTYGSMMMTESVERVEVLEGPGAMLNGAAPTGSIGGTINIIPKRAEDTPLTQLTASYITDSQFGGHVDIGRRFGVDNQFGVRFNGAYGQGDTGIDHNSQHSGLSTLGLDYKGDTVRLSADLGYQDQNTHAPRRAYSLDLGVNPVPAPPDNRTNTYEPWEYWHARSFYGMTRAEVDVSHDFTAFAAFGGNDMQRQSLSSNPEIIDSQGDIAAGRATGTSAEKTSLSAEIGIRGNFDTGLIHHEVVAAYSWITEREAFAPSPVRQPFPASNLFNPVFAPTPSISVPTPGSAVKSDEIILPSEVLGDTLSILNERVQFIAGVRFQTIKENNFDNDGSVDTAYNRSATTPLAGLVVKPWKNVSLYASYIEGLSQGATAPDDAANAGQIFSPYVSKQYETGVKVDLGRITTTFAAYQLTQPSAFTNPDTNVFSVNGEERHRGLELNAFGEVVDGIRLLAGASYIDALLTRTEGGLYQGNRATLAPFQLKIAGEWDTPFLKGFTLTTLVAQVSSQYVDQVSPTGI